MKANMKLAKMLVKEEIKEVNGRWKGTPQENTYHLTMTQTGENDIEIYPTYEGAIYSADEFLRIAKICNLDSYITVQANESGHMAPLIRIYHVVVPGE